MVRLLFFTRAACGAGRQGKAVRGSADPGQKRGRRRGDAVKNKELRKSETRGGRAERCREALIRDRIAERREMERIYKGTGAPARAREEKEKKFLKICRKTLDFLLQCIYNSVST